jgi:hypothetical protein
MSFLKLLKVFRFKSLIYLEWRTLNAGLLVFSSP